MKSKISLIARLLLGLIYFVFGLNGFFHFIPMKPPPMSEAAMAFTGGLMGSGYFMQFLAGTQTLGGFMLLSGIAAPIGLTILAPVTINIALFHLFMTPGVNNQIMPSAMIILHLLAVWAYWPLYRPLFGKSNSRSKLEIA